MNLGLNRISFGKIRKLDRGSIRSSPRYGLSTPYRLTMEQCWTVPLCPCLHGTSAFGPLNLSILDAGILVNLCPQYMEILTGGLKGNYTKESSL